MLTATVASDKNLPDWHSPGVRPMESKSCLLTLSRVDRRETKQLLTWPTGREFGDSAPTYKAGIKPWARSTDSNKTEDIESVD